MNILYSKFIINSSLVKRLKLFLKPFTDLKKKMLHLTDRDGYDAFFSSLWHFRKKVLYIFLWFDCLYGSMKFLKHVGICYMHHLSLCYNTHKRHDFASVCQIMLLKSGISSFVALRTVWKRVLRLLLRVFSCNLPFAFFWVEI